MEAYLGPVLNLLTLLLGGGFGAALLTYLRNRKKDDQDDGATFRSDLMARVSELETRLDAQDKVHRAELEAERKACDAKLNAMEQTIDRMRDLGLSDIWAGKPHFARWWDAMQARPAYRATYYPGTRVTDIYEEIGEPA